MYYRNRQFVFGCLLVLGVAILSYGAFFSAGVVFPKDKTSAAAVLEPEFSLIREVTIGGIKRDEYGRMRKTYTGKPPQACPT